jgi:hypothetical protein
MAVMCAVACHLFDQISREEWVPLFGRSDDCRTRPSKISVPTFYHTAAVEMTRHEGVRRWLNIVRDFARLRADTWDILKDLLQSFSTIVAFGLCYAYSNDVKH